jgi:hypothetical protein
MLMFVNSASHVHSQHARYPIGGDQNKGAASTDAPRGASMGVTIGAAIGAIVGGGIFTAFSAPVPVLVSAIAAGVGAYIGSLIGAMYRTRDVSKSIRQERVRCAQRDSGVLLAVHVTLETQQSVANVLREAGGASIERASGHWQQGRWADFDPTRAPQPVRASEPYADRARERHA